MKLVIHRDKGKAHPLQMAFRQFFSENDVDKALVEIKVDKLTRSGKQNKLYFMWVDIFRNENGYEKIQMHKIFREMFLGYVETIGLDGRVITDLRDTKTLKVDEFAKYLEQVDRFCAEWGCVLPRPDDLYWDSIGVKAP